MGRSPIRPTRCTISYKILVVPYIGGTKMKRTAISVENLAHLGDGEIVSKLWKTTICLNAAPPPSPRAARKASALAGSAALSGTARGRLRSGSPSRRRADVDPLGKARRHVEEAQRIVWEQKGRIIRLGAAGFDTRDAERTLRLFEANLQTFREYKHALECDRLIAAE